MSSPNYDPQIPVECSVIICTHNPRENYLRQALEALQEQSLPKEQWELLLIDNASEIPLDRNWDLSWHPRARHIREEMLGLTPARMRGIREARGSLLVFVDDDNILNADYLERALTIERDYPFLGAWGGQIDPVFESPPPEWTRKYWKMLAIRDLDRDIWSNLTDFSTTPCGAGMCIRGNVAREYVHVVGKDRSRVAFDRRGASLSSGGDSDLALTACDVGLGTGLFRSLRLKHLIPDGRLELEYLAKLSEELAYSLLMLRILRGDTPPNSPGDRHLTIGQLFAFYSRFRMSKQDRAITDAIQRGKKRAVAVWEKHPLRS